MRLIFASDIHGSAYWCGKLMERIADEGVERVILLGDLLYHGPRNDLPRDYSPKEVLAMLGTIAGRITAVRGNCDSEVDQMVLDFPIMADYVPLWLDGKTIFCSHGHLYNPQSPPPLQNGDILMNGHTHLYADEMIGGIRYLNPGSVSLPKEGRPNSYMLYDDGRFILKDMDGKLL